MRSTLSTLRPRPSKMLLPCCTRRAGPVTFLWALMMFVAAAAAAFVLYGEFFGTMSIPPAAARAQAGCSPRDRVVFLKTHKCASSTVQVHESNIWYLAVVE